MESRGLNEIITGCKNNDRHCQKLLFELFSKKMMGVCLRYSSTYETARDLMQDGFIKVFTKIPNFKGDSNLETWLTRIFINTCLSHISKAENKKYYLDINDPEVQYQADIENISDPSDDSIKNMPVDKIFNYINQLPDKYRLVLNLYSIDGLSHQQISESLGIQIGSSKSRLSRARQLLIDLIKEKENLN